MLHVSCLDVVTEETPIACGVTLASNHQILVKVFLAYLAKPNRAAENYFREILAFHEATAIPRASFKTSRVVDRSLFESIILESLFLVMQSMRLKLKSVNTDEASKETLYKDLVVLYRLTEFLPSMSTRQQIEFLADWNAFILSESGQKLLGLIYLRKKRSDQGSFGFVEFLKGGPTLRFPCAAQWMKCISNMLLQSVVFLLIKEVHLPNVSSCYVKDIQLLLLDCMKWLPCSWGFGGPQKAKLAGHDKLFAYSFFDIMLGFLLEKLNRDDIYWLLQVLFSNHEGMIGYWQPESLIKEAKKRLGKTSRRALKRKLGS